MVPGSPSRADNRRSPGGVPVGANGIAKSRDGSLLVANTDRGRIVRVPVGKDGSARAGDVETVVQRESLVGADGIALDVAGNTYVAVNQRNTVARVTHGGRVETVATADDGVLDFPSDLVFGTTPGRLETLFVTNFAFGSGEDARPSLVSIETPEPGFPPQY